MVIIAVVCLVVLVLVWVRLRRRASPVDRASVELDARDCAPESWVALEDQATAYETEALSRRSRAGWEGPEPVSFPGAGGERTRRRT